MATKKKRHKRGEYSSIHQKKARKNSGNTLRARKFLRKLDARIMLGENNDTKHIQEK